MVGEVPNGHGSLKIKAEALDEVVLRALDNIQDLPEDSVVTLTTFNHMVCPGVRMTRDAVCGVSSHGRGGGWRLRVGRRTMRRHDYGRTCVDTQMFLVKFCVK